jgi:hypothetical protein
VCARACKEARSAHGNQTEGAPDLYRQGLARRSIKQHCAGFEPEFASRIDKVTIDDNARPLTQSQPGVLSQVNREAGLRPGADQIDHEHRGISLESAARALPFGRGLASDVFAEASAFGVLRLCGA